MVKPRYLVCGQCHMLPRLQAQFEIQPIGHTYGLTEVNMHPRISQNIRCKTCRLMPSYVCNSKDWYNQLCNLKDCCNHKGFTFSSLGVEMIPLVIWCTIIKNVIAAFLHPFNSVQCTFINGACMYNVCTLVAP